MPRRPRWIKANSAYCGAQRTVDRQFLFKPDASLRNLVGACAARAQRRFPVTIYWLDCNINHKHSGLAPLSDSPEHLNNLVRFQQLFNSLLARELNARLDREGPVFASRDRSDEADDDASLEQQLLYSVTNVVKDGLVERVAHWPGFSSYKQLATGEVERFTYVDRTAWHRAGGAAGQRPLSAFVRTVELRLSPIPSWSHLRPEQRQTLFRRRVRHLEQAFREERQRESRPVMSPARLAKIDPRDRPKSPPKRSRMPLCHSSSPEGARSYRDRLRAFLDAFYSASGRWLAGIRDVEFPLGSFRPPLIQVAT